jgi:hypothetical protein
MVRAVVGLGVMGAIVVALSCSDAQPGAGGDCPIGTFRPVGIKDCVIPSDNAGGIADSRCALGAQAPTCDSSSGLRPYFATSTHCAPGYQYQAGSCMSGAGGGFGGTGVGGFSGSFGDGVGFMEGGPGGFGFADGVAADGVGFMEGSIAGVSGTGGAAGDMPTDAMPETAHDASGDAPLESRDAPFESRDASDGAGS